MSDSAPLVVNDRYELRGLIGRGGMAEVYRGLDRVLGRDIAVKLMHPALTGDVDRQRFVSETRLLASLNNPHLVMLLDAGVDDSGGSPRPWLVMELVEGPTLAQRLVDGPLPAEEVAAIGVGLADGLQHVHGKGIVHRDVKPANVLLTGTGTAKLADFGVARLMHERSDLTGADHTIGTAAYLAPEQVRGEPVTGASDVYSFGLVLLETLTGRRTFGGTATEAALARLSSSPLIPVSLGAGWVHLLDEMTARDPRDRPTAAEVAARLSAMVSNAASAAAPVLVEPGPTGTMPVPLVPSASATPPRRVLAGLVAVGCLIAAAGLAWISTAGTDAQPPPADAAARTSSPPSASKDQTPRGVAPSSAVTTASPDAAPDRTREVRRAAPPDVRHKKQAKASKASKAPKAQKPDRAGHKKAGHGKKGKRKHKRR